VALRSALRPVDDPLSHRWQRIEWTPWVSLHEAASTYRGIPRKQGIYRIRTRRGTSLLYIGISVRLAGRLQGLERAIHRPDHKGHYAGRCVSRARGVEISWIVLEELDKRQLMGREVDLVAAYRRVMKASPRCQFAGQRIS